MSDEHVVERAIADVVSALGRIDILVNGAGHNIRKPLIDMSREEFDSITDVHPGYFVTPLTQQHAPEIRQAIAGETPLGRFGEPKELIGPAVFLASGASSFVTGTSLMIDGGWTAR